ncbi:MAG: sulfite exporter TauE/SafE family protein [Cyanobacteria bacterium P01_A01_bin.37]
MLFEVLLFLGLGLGVGTISGMIGIGGGVLITPALIYLFGFEQKIAQGTTLALLVPPIGILGAWAYYQQGLVNIKAASLICLGFVLGGLMGAKFAVDIEPNILRRVFGFAMLAISIRMIWSSFAAPNQ